ncbi:hypothetical protein [Naasia lichenicola]|uniref:Protein RecA n=1 Tax=Naasia lichenicola TaxID=2565933 RepID=A0A4S4FS93_9MICO|nr:hypothetical protein [Naasia lichenicola]THG33161.1 hypothetical protein E6C64_02045 [Naasia lichenicola]
MSLASARAADPAATVQELQSRIREMQATTLDTKSIATHPMFAGLLPDGMLKAGSAYSVHGSMTLAMAMLTAPSQAGAWCGVVGVPEFGAQAAAGYGIDLERLVLVPDPGEQWQAVTAAMVDVLTVVVLRAPARISDGDANRLAARLRKREATLISLGDWPGTEARLTVERSEWSGIGTGHGMLTGRTAFVTVENRGVRIRARKIWLPGVGSEFADAAATAASDSGAIPSRHLRPVEDADRSPHASHARAV